MPFSEAPAMLIQMVTAGNRHYETVTAIGEMFQKPKPMFVAVNNSG